MPSRFTELGTSFPIHHHIVDMGESSPVQKHFYEIRDWQEGIKAANEFKGMVRAHDNSHKALDDAKVYKHPPLNEEELSKYAREVIYTNSILPEEFRATHSIEDLIKK